MASKRRKTNADREGVPPAERAAAGAAATAAAAPPKAAAKAWAVKVSRFSRLISVDDELYLDCSRDEVEQALEDLDEELNKHDGVWWAKPDETPAAAQQGSGSGGSGSTKIGSKKRSFPSLGEANACAAKVWATMQTSPWDSGEPAGGEDENAAPAQHEQHCTVSSTGAWRYSREQMLCIDPYGAGLSHLVKSLVTVEVVPLKCS